MFDKEKYEYVKRIEKGLIEIADINFYSFPEETVEFLAREIEGLKKDLTNQSEEHKK